MSDINIAKLVSKEVFALEKDGAEKLYMVSSFDDEHDNREWFNIYDYDILSTTGEFVPYFTAGDKVQEITYYKQKRTVLLVEDLHSKMQELGFVWKY